MKESYHVVEKKETRELAEFPEGFPGLSPKIIQEFPILDSRGVPRYLVRLRLVGVDLSFDNLRTGSVHPY